MTSGIDSSAILRQAQQVHKQAETTHKKGVQTEANDMRKANSIFTEAEKIISAEANKGNKVGESAEQDLNKLQQDAEKVGSSEISPTKTLIEEYKKTLDEALKKKEELESKLSAEEKDAATELSVSKNVQKQIKTTAKSTAKASGNDGNNDISGGEEINVVSGSSDSDDKSAIMQEYRDTLAQIDALSSLSSSLGEKLETSVTKINGIKEKALSKKESAEQKLNEIQTNINTKAAEKSNELSPLIQSQSTDAQVHTQSSSATSQMSDTASQAASQLDVKDPNKVALESISKELSADSIDLSTLSDSKNTPNAQTNIPKIGNDIQQALNDAINGDFSNINSAIQTAYQDAMGTISNYSEEPEGAEEVSTENNSELSESKSEKKEDSGSSNISQAILSSIGGSTSVEGILTSVVSSALDEMLPGLGSIASGVFNTLKGIFS